jgi:hypothetical protein
MKKPKRLWAVDTEDNSKGKVYLINFCDENEKHHTFKKPKDAIEFLQNQSGSIDIWATNLGYDLSNIFQEHMSCLEITYIKGRVITAKIQGTGITFKDTLNHWKISVAEMGKRINLPKFKTESFNNVKYCRRDTLITRRFVASMEIKYAEIGAKLKSTIGSTALDIFKTRYHTHTFERSFKTSDIEWMLGGYYGGRTEIFHTKPIAGFIRYYDFNSLYPSVMVGRDFPIIGGHGFRLGDIETTEGISEASVLVSRDIEIPYLPVRSKQGLIFPTGKFTGRWTNFELRECQKYGVRIEKIHKSFSFIGSYRPFDDFVRDLYEFRLKAQKDGDLLLSDSAKLILNNLYGKFAQGNEITRLLPYKKENLKNGDKVFRDLLLRDEKGEFPVHTNVVWSAYVTAYGRDKLYRGMLKTKANGGRLLYCDTDSIIFEGGDPLPTSNQLGDLKLEGVWNWAHFKLPKLYRLDGETRVTRAKGVPRLSADEFFDQGFAQFKKPNKLRESLRRKLTPNEWVLTRKEIRRTYDKRHSTGSGTTKPIHLE